MNPETVKMWNSTHAELQSRLAELMDKAMSAGFKRR